jgi:hypothetical protein
MGAGQTDLLRDFFRLQKRPCREGQREYLAQRSLSDTPNGCLYMFGVNENIRSNAIVDGLTLAVR